MLRTRQDQQYSAQAPPVPGIVCDIDDPLSPAARKIVTIRPQGVAAVNAAALRWMRVRNDRKGVEDRHRCAAELGPQADLLGRDLRRIVCELLTKKSYSGPKDV
jgi:hypothetical protein